MTLEHLTGLVSLLCALVLSAIVLSVHIREGLLIKIGLILMILGLIGSGLILIKGFDSLNSLLHSGLLMRVGMLVSASGYALNLCKTWRKPSSAQQNH